MHAPLKDEHWLIIEGQLSVRILKKSKLPHKILGNIKYVIIVNMSLIFLISLLISAL